MPAGDERQRRRGVGGAAQVDVGVQRLGVAEDVEAGDGRVLEEVKGDAVLVRRTGDAGVPRRDHVDLVAARGDGLGDRLHEGADAVAGKARIRSRHHHDDVAGHGDLRKISRHGVISDSISTEPDTFDCPWRRSTKMIGTSPKRQPARRASKSISTRNA